jgi:diacylglycerol O-acyltransferase
MSLQRMSGVDSIFLAAERPGHHVHVMGVLILDPSTVPGGYSFQGFRDFAAARLPALTPLRRRLVEVPGGLANPYWTDAGEIDLDHHIRRAAVPSPGGPRELAAMASEMIERPLDRRLPLWEMLLVEGLAGGRVALLAKLSHAMMDGMAGVRLMASLFTTTPELAEPLPARAPETRRDPNPLELLAGAVPWLLRRPLRAAGAGLGTARGLLSRALSGRVAAPAPPVQTERCWLNTQLSPTRATAWVTLPLADVRAVGEAADSSVNDVLLAVVGGALRRYAEPRGVLPEAPLVAGVPVALRNDEERANAVTSVAVGIGTDEPDPAARLRAIRDAMAEKKDRRGSTVGEGLLAWAEVPPPLLLSLVMRAYLDLDLEARFPPICNLVLSNVPGPPESLYLAGARLEAIHPLGPVFSGLALNITAMGCGDGLDVGLVACRRVVPDLWDLADALPEALAELRAALAGAPPRTGRAAGP